MLSILLTTFSNDPIPGFDATLLREEPGQPMRSKSRTERYPRDYTAHVLTALGFLLIIVAGALPILLRL
ncbi:hypothetical protein GCM10007888_46990 [Methylobacterium oxalidis]|uniref:Uncharacterized protein n=1 Tax=Methylobacterium oxalidis TaxID=944322 RepID=A0ABQ6DQC0_9HYPH|nr:hypothetical protein GCM10007888_46990 [Methylobacterium oxalidis]